MGILNRITVLFRAKANSALDAAEDPRQSLDYSYKRQLDLLRDVRRGIVEVTASKRRLQFQAGELREKLATIDQQARQALAMEREDLARAALERKQLSLAQLQHFEAEASQLEVEQERLTRAEARLAAKIEAFRTRKEVIKAQYSAGQAQVRIGEAVSGLSEESADIAYTIRRAEDKTAQLRSRGEAIGELIDTGVLTDALEPGNALDHELTQLGADYRVEAELEQLRRELAPPVTPKKLEPGQ